MDELAPIAQQTLGISKDEAERINTVVAQAIVRMSTPGDGTIPVFSVFDIARESQIHPMLVAAAIRYNPRIKELSALLAEATVSELLSRYLHYILSPEDEFGNIDMNGVMVRRPSKDQIEAIRFFIMNKQIVSPSSGGKVDQETETARLLGTRTADDSALDPERMTEGEKIQYLKSAMAYMAPPPDAAEMKRRGNVSTS